MGQKDIISKQIFKRILEDVANHIFKLQLETVELIETEQQRIEDRQADLVARVKDSDGKEFILHIEIQNQNQTEMPDRMLRYLSDLRLGHPDETVYQYLLYIGKPALTMPCEIQTEQLQYRYSVIDMHNLDYQFFINQDSPDAIIMAVLCDMKDKPARTIIHEIIVKLSALTQQDSKRLREYLSMLEILASNRNINLDIQQEFEMLQIEIEKLPSYLMGEENGRVQGLKQGLEKGLRIKALTIAEQLIEKGLPLADIAEVTGLDIGELTTLAGKKPPLG